jgi:hypothetical protein
VASKFTETIASGKYDAQLLALRDHLAERLETAGHREAAPLARQLAIVLERINAQSKPEVSSVDDLAAKRSRRRAASSAS